MEKKPYSSFNIYFLLPFALWVVAGAISLLTYDKQSLFSLFNTHYTPWSDTLMRYITDMGAAPFIIIVLLISLGINSLRNWWYIVLIILANSIPSIITQIVKGMANAPRPLKYFNEAPWIHRLPDVEVLMDYSFPSGHTCGAFGLFCLLSCMLKPQYKFWGITFFALALLVAYSRMYLAAHFFEDVYVGSIIGTVTTLLILQLMRRLQPRFFKKQ